MDVTMDKCCDCNMREKDTCTCFVSRYYMKIREDYKTACKCFEKKIDVPKIDLTYSPKDDGCLQCNHYLYSSCRCSGNPLYGKESTVKCKDFVLNDEMKMLRRCGLCRHRRLMDYSKGLLVNGCLKDNDYCGSLVTPGKRACNDFEAVKLE